MAQGWNRSDHPVRGTIEMAPKVIEVITRIAALEVQGIYEISGSIVGDIRKKLGNKNFTSGIHVEIDAQGVIIHVPVIVDYKQSIPQVTNQLQQNIKRSIEMMTSLTVKHINVFVTDVKLPSRQ